MVSQREAKTILFASRSHFVVRTSTTVMAGKLSCHALLNMIVCPHQRQISNSKVFIKHFLISNWSQYRRRGRKLKLGKILHERSLFLPESPKTPDESKKNSPTWTKLLYKITRMLQSDIIIVTRVCAQPALRSAWQRRCLHGVVLSPFPFHVFWSVFWIFCGQVLPISYCPWAKQPARGSI